MSTTLTIVVIAILSYIVGSFPTATFISRRFFGYDIREKGSGNMGSTNAFRILGWKWGLAVQLIDITKGLIAVLLVANILGKGLAFHNITYFENITLIRIMAGIFAVLGHIFSVFVNFKGGKGINTAAGMLFAIAPVDFGVCAFVFTLAVGMSGYISLGSILSAMVLPASLIIRHNIFGIEIPGYLTLVYFFIALCILIVYTHRENVKRLLKGNENRFNKLRFIKFK